jgi:hypothetical protein
MSLSTLRPSAQQIDSALRALLVQAPVPRRPVRKVRLVPGLRIAFGVHLLRAATVLLHRLCAHTQGRAQPVTQPDPTTAALLNSLMLSGFPFTFGLPFGGWSGLFHR